MEVSDNLIKDVANYLDITWEMSEEETSKLKGMIARGAAAIRVRVGECDFSGDTPEKTLLLNHVMYERSGALHEFYENYAKDLMSIKVHNMMTEEADNAET